MSRLDFHGRVALVTGAGSGLGRAHALALAGRGAKVLVNDMPDAPGAPGASAAAEAVAQEIRAGGGEAASFGASVVDYAAVQAMVDHAMRAWGRVDVLVNNAGVLRDKSFAKMSLDDFSLVMDVHLMGAVHCCKAVWDIMRAQNRGRIVMTTSSSGLWGNFGQSNYGAAKMALVGLMNTLALEGAKNDIRVNALSPTAATPMTEGLLPGAMLDLLKPEAVTPAMLFLASDEAPTRSIVCAGAGGFEVAHVALTAGLHLGSGGDAAERLAARFAEVADRRGDAVLAQGMEQGQREVARAMAQGRPGAQAAD